MNDVEFEKLKKELKEELAQLFVQEYKKATQPKAWSIYKKEVTKMIADKGYFESDLMPSITMMLRLRFGLKRIQDITAEQYYLGKPTIIKFLELIPNREPIVRRSDGLYISGGGYETQEDL